MSFLENRFTSSDFGLMPLSEVSARLASAGDHDATVSALKEFVTLCFQKAVPITGRRDASSPRTAIPADAFEGVPIFDWGTCSDDDLFDLACAHSVLFVSVGGDDGDTIKQSAASFTGTDQTVWSDLAVERSQAQALLTNEAREQNSAPVRRHGRRSSPLRQAVIDHIVERFEFHGDLDPSDEEWSIQADVEREAVAFLGTKIGESKMPAESTIRGWVTAAVSEWEKRKADEGR